MKNFLSGFANIIAKRKTLIIVIIILLTAGIGFMMTRLYFDNDMTNWVSPKSELGELPHYINQKFGGNNPILVIAEFDDVFTETNLNWLKTLSDSISELEGVDSSISLADIQDIQTDEYGIVVNDLIEYPLENDPSYYAELKDYVLSKSSYRGNVISDDGKSAIMLVLPEYGARVDRVATAVKNTGDALAENHDHITLHYSGNPALMNAAFELVVHDLIFLVPFVVIIIVMVLYFSFRTVNGIIIPLTAVVFSCAITMGLMGLLAIPLSVFGAAIPVIIIAVGSAYGIHVMASYYENQKLLKETHSVSRTILLQVGLPVLMSGLTTFFGFMSLITSKVITIQRFGIAISIGVLVSVAVSLIFIPAVLEELKIRKQRITAESKSHPGFDAFIDAFTAFVYKRKGAIIIIFSILTITGIIFTTQIQSEVNMLNYLDPNSRGYQSTKFAVEVFGGMNPWDVYIKGDAGDPDLLKAVWVIQEKMSAYPGTDPQSVSSMIAELNHSLVGIKTVPETEGEIDDLWFFLGDRNELDVLLSEDEDEMLITMMLPNIDNQIMDEMFIELEDVISEYRDGFVMVSNSAARPQIADLIVLSLDNLLNKDGDVVSNSQIESAVDRLMNAYDSKEFGIPLSAAYDYALSEQSEIEFNPAQAVRMTNALSSIESYQADEIDAGTEIINERLTGAKIVNNPEDVEELYYFAESLAYRFREASNIEKIDYLIGTIREFLPELSVENEDTLNAVLAPILWETFPITDETSSAALRTVIPEEMEQTGMAYLISGIWKGLFTNQMFTVVIALTTVFLLNLLTFKSVKKALISLIAITFSILFNFGLMGLFKIPLDFVTAVIAGVSIGIGIDYTIHFITRYFTELEQNNGDRLAAYRMTIRHTGRAITFNALSVGLGFAVLVFAALPPLRIFGWMLTEIMFISAISSMTLLPAGLFFLKDEENERKRLPKERKRLSGVGNTGDGEVSPVEAND